MKKLFTKKAGVGVASSATSGKCGVNLTWELSDDGVLTISGTGDVHNYAWPDSPPWYSNRNSIHIVIINDGVTTIGKWAFYGCSSLTSPVYNAHCFAYMPTSYSGAYSIPEGITQIAGGAFHGCSSLTSVTIPNSVTTIGDYAFRNCSSLTSVTINSDAILNKDYSSVDNLKKIFASQVTEYIILKDISLEAK